MKFKVIVLSTLLGLSVVLPANAELPSLEYCQEYRQDIEANAESSSESFSTGASGYGGPGFGGGSAEYEESESESSENYDSKTLERDCNSVLKTYGEITIEQIRANIQEQSIEENSTTDRYTACLQSAQYMLESRRQDHLNGCQCLAGGQTPVFYGATGIFHSCKDNP